MDFTSPKASRIALFITALVFSRASFLFINDPEGPNLLIVVVMAAVLYGLSRSVYRFNLSDVKKFALAVVVQLLLVGGFLVFDALTPKQLPVAQGEQQGGIVAENPDGEADPSRMTLDMKTWDWISALYNDGRTITPKTTTTSTKKFTLTFNKNGTFTASTDCNAMGGSYNAKDGRMTFSDIFMTEMYCEGSQETEFLNLLKNTAEYHFTGRGQLILGLKFDSGTVTFR